RVVDIDDRYGAVDVNLLAATGEGEAEADRSGIFRSPRDLSRRHVEDPEFGAGVAEAVIERERVARLAVRRKPQARHAGRGWPNRREIKRALCQVDLGNAKDAAADDGVDGVEQRRHRPGLIVRIVTGEDVERIHPGVRRLRELDLLDHFEIRCVEDHDVVLEVVAILAVRRSAKAATQEGRRFLLRVFLGPNDLLLGRINDRDLRLLNLETVHLLDARADDGIDQAVLRIGLDAAEPDAAIALV